MTWKSIYHKAKYYGQLFPFTLHGLLIAIVAFGAYWFFFKQPPNEAGVDEELRHAYWPIIILILKIVLSFAAILVLVSVLSTLLVWVYFKIRSSRKHVNPAFEFSQTKAKGIRIHASIPYIIKPLLGYVKMRLQYDNHELTETLIISNRWRNKSDKNFGLKGTNQLYFPDIKAYRIDKVVLQLEDMLQLISLPVVYKMNVDFHQAPNQKPITPVEVPPQSASESDERTQEIRKTEGEYLHYKQFASGDDVRRVVWKIYAKNRELVVRTPEQFNPFASDILILASFYTPTSSHFSQSSYGKEMLNYYKHTLWSIYDSLKQSEQKVIWRNDQGEPLVQHSAVEWGITTAEWQSQYPLSQHVARNKVTTLCISSLTTADELRDTLANSPATTVVFFCKLSSTFRRGWAVGWLARIFIQAPSDRLKRIRNSWTISPYKWKVKKQEKEILATLQDSNVKYVVL